MLGRPTWDHEGLWPVPLGPPGFSWGKSGPISSNFGQFRAILGNFGQFMAISGNPWFQKKSGNFWQFRAISGNFRATFWARAAPNEVDVI